MYPTLEQMITEATIYRILIKRIVWTVVQSAVSPCFFFVPSHRSQAVTSGLTGVKVFLSFDFLY